MSFHLRLICIRLHCLLATWERHCWGNGDASVSKQTVARGQVVGLPWWLRGEESTCNAVDLHSDLGSGRSPGEGSGYPLQYSCLENFMGRGAWRATVHGGLKESDTTERLTLSRLYTITCIYVYLFKNESQQNTPMSSLRSGA